MDITGQEIEQGSCRPSLRPPRRRRLPNPAIPWEGAMTITQVTQLAKTVPDVNSFCFREPSEFASTSIAKSEEVKENVMAEAASDMKMFTREFDITSMSAMVDRLASQYSPQKYLPLALKPIPILPNLEEDLAGAGMGALIPAASSRFYDLKQTFASLENLFIPQHQALCVASPSSVERIEEVSDCEEVIDVERVTQAKQDLPSIVHSYTWEEEEMDEEEMDEEEEMNEEEMDEEEMDSEEKLEKEEMYEKKIDENCVSFSLEDLEYDNATGQLFIHFESGVAEVNDPN